MTLRVAAVLALVCFVVHAALAIIGGSHELPSTVPMLLLSLLCFMCGAMVWRRGGTRREAAMMVVGGLVMIAVHLVLMQGLASDAMAPNGGTPLSDHNHNHNHNHNASSQSTSLVDTLMHLGATISGMQVTVAALGLVGRREGGVSGTPSRGMFRDIEAHSSRERDSNTADSRSR